MDSGQWDARNPTLRLRRGVCPFGVAARGLIPAVKSLANERRGEEDVDLQDALVWQRRDMETHRKRVKPYGKSAPLSLGLSVAISRAAIVVRVHEIPGDGDSDHG
jgi:hypothetical protein